MIISSAWIRALNNNEEMAGMYKMSLNHPDIPDIREATKITNVMLEGLKDPTGRGSHWSKMGIFEF